MTKIHVVTIINICCLKVKSPKVPHHGFLPLKLCVAMLQGPSLVALLFGNTSIYSIFF